MTDFSLAEIKTTDLLTVPHFKHGYAHGFDGGEADGRSWMPHESVCYDAGVAFAKWLIATGEGRVPLAHGTLPHARAECLLIRWRHIAGESYE